MKKKNERSADRSGAEEKRRDILIYTSLSGKQHDTRLHRNRTNNGQDSTAYLLERGGVDGGRDGWMVDG